MKRLILCSLLICITVYSIAQTKLHDSRRSSAHSYLYTISPDSLRKIHLENKEIHEEMLGEYITNYRNEEQLPDLPAGNYVIVKADGSNMIFTEYTVDDLCFQLVTSNELRLYLYDLSGNQIKDAVVRQRGKTMSFNAQTQTYNTKRIKHKEVLEIENKGVYHYIEILTDRPYYSYTHKSNIFCKTQRKLRYLWSKTKRTNNTDGFIVFNKPIYKPGETVKLKAYMTNRNGSPHTKGVYVNLYGFAGSKIDTILTYLTPYRPGMYEYQFELSDSLNLKLDNPYAIWLTDKTGWKTIGHFRYEEYELKSTRFTMTTQKEEYLYEEPVELVLSVTDENELTVYDGRIEILVTPGSFTESSMWKEEAVFIPDTLWHHTVDIENITDKKFLLPDTIFPAGVSLDFKVQSTYLSADNEKRVQTKNLKRIASSYAIDFTLSDGILHVKELHNGKPEPAQATIQITGENGEILSAESILLPHSIPVAWFASGIKVMTGHSSATYDLSNLKENLLDYRFYRSADSVHLKVSNPAGIPFWYSIHRNKKEVAKGYTTSPLDYSVKDRNENGYNMQLTYLAGGKNKIITGNLPFIRKELSVEVSTPTTVYPGQTTDVLVAVKNGKGKPVKGIDVTAYSFTSKFENAPVPAIQSRQKIKQAVRHTNKRIIPVRSSISGKMQPLNWDKWKQTMGLNTNEYYKFLYPDTYYCYTESTPDGSTLVSPYVVIDGVLQGVHILWIDEKLYYYSKTNHWDSYVFPVSPGLHTFRFRTYNREIEVKNVYIGKGTKNILSFKAGTSHVISGVKVSSTLLDKNRWGSLGNEETRELRSELITIDNNLGRFFFPGASNIPTLHLPVTIKSGNIFYYLNPDAKSSTLTGPFPDRKLRNGIMDMASVYIEDELFTDIGIEGGYRYSLYDNYQKLKNWDRLPGGTTIDSFTPELDIEKNQPVTPERIREYHKQTFKQTVSTATGRARSAGDYQSGKESNSSMTLYLGKDENGQSITPELIYIKPQKRDPLSQNYLYYGGTRQFRLPAEDMIMTLIFNDSTTYSKQVTLQTGGVNFIRLDSITYESNRLLAREGLDLLKRNIHKTFIRSPYTQEAHTAENSVDISSVLQGRVSGIQTRYATGYEAGATIRIRGSESLAGTHRPLLIVDGMPYDGSLEDLDPSMVASLTILKDAASSAIFGSRAASGVIVIQTGDAGITLPEEVQEQDTHIPEISLEQGNAMRRNFHDDAFWQPRLKTDAKGEASFEVTYPDDITRWNAYFLAIGKKRQADKKQISIRSFKTLSAHLSTPRFAIRGDSLNMAGRITNHSGESIPVEKGIHLDDMIQKEKLNVSSSYVDYIPLRATTGDSVTVAYSVETPNGYFDGEERSFPIFEQGMLQTHGDFKVIHESTPHTFTTMPELGEVTLYAEASGLKILLHEVETVHRYRYLCNEQMASKIKALLAKRKVYHFFEKEFKEDRNIKDLIARLTKNRNQRGLWGWWNASDTQVWISRHVISALLDAREAGFEVKLDTESISSTLERELQKGIANLDRTLPEKINGAKLELLDRLLFLKQLDAQINYENYFRQIDMTPKDSIVTNKLKTMHVMSVIGLEKEIPVDTLMKYSHTTMLGGLYWGDKAQYTTHARYTGLSPYQNNTEKTLLAYEILKKQRGYDAELTKIQTYLFENRRSGSWQNTYESSRIIETVMPDLLQESDPYQQVEMFVNDKRVTSFPYTGKFSPGDSIEVQKKGTLPLFVTAYQQGWNSHPEAESAKGITVRSYFVANSDTVSYLQAGKVARLEVIVKMDASAEYVQIEVPVPAGCSYETKARSSYRKEIHREHYKEKVVIFCNSLAEGEHRFTVELIPRYTGHYTLNPAKAELMYFPTFYGNEEIKSISIE